MEASHKGHKGQLERNPTGQIGDNLDKRIHVSKELKL